MILKRVKDDFNALPGWARMIFIGGFLASIIKWFPIIELLELFLLIVVVPLGFLTFVGLISKETSNTIIATWTMVCNLLRKEIKEAGTSDEKAQTNQKETPEQVMTNTEVEA
jgi:hypothetical protein